VIKLIIEWIEVVEEVEGIVEKIEVVEKVVDLRVRGSMV